MEGRLVVVVVRGVQRRDRARAALAGSGAGAAWARPGGLTSVGVVNFEEDWRSAGAICCCGAVRGVASV